MRIRFHASRNRSNCSKLSNRDITRRVIRSARTAKHWLQRNGFVTPVFSLDDQLSNYLTESEFTHNQFRTNGQAAYQRVANSGAPAVHSLPVIKWAAAAVLLVALNLASVYYYTASKQKAVASVGNENPIAASLEVSSTYNY